jgi:hypothetical protein
VLWTGEPEYCVVVDADDDTIITVLFRTTEYYARNGATFVAKAG